jgi:hypothetical protein
MVVIGAATGFYFYNKGSINIGNAKAKKAWLKIPEVSGTIKQVSKNQQNQVIVF